MARKNILNYQLLSAQSMSASFNSPITLIKNLDNISYQINITTTNSTGTFAVQVSDDYKVDEVTGVVVNAGNWVSLTLGGGTPFANAANDQIVINLNQLPFGAVRLAYTSTIAGTGHLDLFMSARQLGG